MTNGTKNMRSQVKVLCIGYGPSPCQVHEKHHHHLLVNSTRLATEEVIFQHSANVQLIIVKYSSFGKSQFHPPSPWDSGRSVSLCLFYRCEN